MQTPKQRATAKGCIYCTNHSLVLRAGGLSGDSDSAARANLEHMFSRSDAGSASGVRRRGKAVEQTPDLCTTDATALPRSTSLLSEVSLARGSIVTPQRFGSTRRGHRGRVGRVPTLRGSPTGSRAPSVPGTGSQLCRAAGDAGLRAPQLDTELHPRTPPRDTGHHPGTQDTIPGHGTPSRDTGHHSRIQDIIPGYRTQSLDTGHHPGPRAPSLDTGYHPCIQGYISGPRASSLDTGHHARPQASILGHRTPCPAPGLKLRIQGTILGHRAPSFGPRAPSPDTGYHPWIQNIITGYRVPSLDTGHCTMPDLRAPSPDRGYHPRIRDIIPGQTRGGERAQASPPHPAGTPGHLQPPLPAALRAGRGGRGGRGGGGGAAPAAAAAPARPPAYLIWDR